ncbi:hypothetical protein PAPYR_11463 [Paratrimastix pyriformis]|uniref:Uncharacterized protein n=1 Tax=Paratrimastix pyriformis TaxID=342808 RepID=A0ABQ8U3R8_9EUKA|nr:hypothetical protein PAPYR_11463 [Paratrimastix pyriformis]
MIFFLSPFLCLAKPNFSQEDGGSPAADWQARANSECDVIIIDLNPCLTRLVPNQIPFTKQPKQNNLKGKLAATNDVDIFVSNTHLQCAALKGCLDRINLPFYETVAADESSIAKNVCGTVRYNLAR